MYDNNNINIKYTSCGIDVHSDTKIDNNNMLIITDNNMLFRVITNDSLFANRIKECTYIYIIIILA